MEGKVKNTYIKIILRELDVATKKSVKAYYFMVHPNTSSEKP